MVGLVSWYYCNIIDGNLPLIMQPHWQILHKLKETNKKARQEEIGKTLLVERGLKTPKQRDEFFQPQNPSQIDLKKTGISPVQVKKAISRIKQAIRNQELIVIYGDYDADGISSTAILWETLYALKAKAFPFIPHREEHGYGLKEEGIKTIISQRGKPKLIITVDNGIVAFSGAKYCQKNGIDLIICDHHQMKNSKFEIRNSKMGKIETKFKKILPPAVAIVHTTQLAGAGGAWFLAREIATSY